jgi:hypothetical protein
MLARKNDPPIAGQFQLKADNLSISFVYLRKSLTLRLAQTHSQGSSKSGTVGDRRRVEGKPPKVRFFTPEEQREWERQYPEPPGDVESEPHRSRGEQSCNLLCSKNSWT